MEARNTDKQQGTIWQDEASRLVFAELVNVFYTREISRLANELDHGRLKKKLASLPYYIERAATHIVLGDVPLQLDSHNGCWVATQKKIPSQGLDKIHLYYENKAEVGLVVPVVVTQAHETSLCIDMIDQVNQSQIHCNQFGWFTLDGQGVHSSDLSLLRPTKALMTAACCGHRWHYHKIVTPRVLGLREMLLASSINWRNVTKRKLVSG
ncbi:hypothetical protein [Pseudoalteromonas luteoviolacea]|uniref:Uncharacterized protein n=1 Tax=Pseudoalteromonas luteoviolacea S4054 TaxID=1129367 RepID=A0A0F6AGT7_9GAMM|nr:hypothetical protein [Pseudoalteromonas luteoviolacea]AOT07152.1 hypothetical protein S4054249_04435 [Pseudoalteromonas luteoviolacea]AOT12069.1 hypothetical protein S40542_04435 [Pseudoalteromonas luteoviolacea]AOT16982.1 hypothetical protein S4054_04435 [Pseudoalteromonas luteoviolacea]KKE85430.1 hypothetical protein N479_05350 [Pseudoalteromonas luteoviolacea S4054]KZN73778.1 hypothetical protein N481_11760 [Pseudoalteromonas luteoviolacea S4047-1]